MNIGQFSETFYPIVDGVGRVVWSYANTLGKRGHECYVIAPMANTGYRGGYPFELIEYSSTSVPGSPQYSTGFAVLDRHYHDRIEKIRFDIVHAHTPFLSGSEALHIARKQKIPLVGTFHSKYYDDFYKATKSEMLAHAGTRIVVDFYSRCDEVWAVSRSTADVLHNYGYEGDIFVMENGAELREKREEDRLAAMKEYRLHEGEAVLLFAGQLNWKKNIEVILKAAALLKKKDLPFRLVLAGQGPDADAIKDLSNSLGIADVTLFTGHVMNNELLDGLYQAASLLVFPSLYDNAPMVLREAAVMGTPAVLTRGSNAAEILSEGVNGLLADNTPEDLAQTVYDALRDIPRLHSLGEAARSTIPTSWEDIMEHVLARYQYLCEHNRRKLIS